MDLEMEHCKNGCYPKDKRTSRINGVCRALSLGHWGHQRLIGWEPRHRGDTAATGDLLGQERNRALQLLSSCLPLAPCLGRTPWKADESKAGKGRIQVSPPWHRKNTAKAGVQLGHGDFHLSFGHWETHSPNSTGSS